MAARLWGRLVYEAAALPGRSSDLIAWAVPSPTPAAHTPVPTTENPRTGRQVLTCTCRAAGSWQPWPPVTTRVMSSHLCPWAPEGLFSLCPLL